MDIKAYMFYFVLVTAAIIIKNGKILIAKRKEGKWEFPGGRVEKGEDMEEIDQYNFMEADKKIIEKMVREFDKNLIKVKK